MRNIDLNLLVIFDAIMTENSISGAAERLSMTQPAVSNAVARMRQVWNDPLFVKNGRGIQPTTHALSLWHQVSGPLIQLKDAVNPQDFDPSSTRRRFRVGMSDITTDLIWLPMRRMVETEAPNIDLHAVPANGNNSESILTNGEVDIIVGVMQEFRTSFRNDFLFESDYVCAMRKDHPLAAEPLTLEKYLKADHLLVSLTGEATGFVDITLSQQGLSRRVAMTVNHFASVPALLEGSDLISIVPNMVIAKGAKCGSLHVTKPPLEIRPTPVSMIWHARHDRDPGVLWLREKIKFFTIAEWLKYLPSCCPQVCHLHPWEDVTEEGEEATMD
ncbi:LysR family transcriptional regulator [Hahella aquimaris]|uniref:LysR family transcriptional regulator n=1 Tax=Hahella sp. HNIBRBA332 TaxID=3015983 RepID=UPI00273BBB0A|nr:LysR family transcriptional regulator [Hahella sp. HNIBRBA332]WLQ13150.1 LysR family transcriptional regulator [Hahella sp. HNIBRBA332]